MFVEGEAKPVATQTVKVPEGTEVVPITGLKYIPQTPGEKKITLRVKPKEGELLQANNEISTFVTVLKGGLNVLYLQGPTPTWEYKFLFRVDRRLARHPGRAEGRPPPGRRDRPRSTTTNSHRAATTSTSSATSRPITSRASSSALLTAPSRRGRA